MYIGRVREDHTGREVRQYLLDKANSLPVLPMLRDPRFPNVLPEGTEDPIGIMAIRVPGRNTRMCQLPSLTLGPGILEAEPAEAIGRVGVRVYPLYPYPAA